MSGIACETPHGLVRPPSVLASGPLTEEMLMENQFLVWSRMWTSGVAKQYSITFLPDGVLECAPSWSNQWRVKDGVLEFMAGETVRGRFVYDENLDMLIARPWHMGEQDEIRIWQAPAQ